MSPLENFLTAMVEMSHEWPLSLTETEAILTIYKGSAIPIPPDLTIRAQELGIITKDH